MRKLVKKLVNRYNTSDPLQLCKEIGIKVIFQELGNINGYTTTNNRIKIIVINENINSKEKIYTIAHELGHILLKHRYNKLWMSAKTFYNNNKYENEANIFAIKLLLMQYQDDIDNMEYPSYENISNLIGVPYKILLNVAHRIFK